MPMSAATFKSLPMFVFFKTAKPAALLGRGACRISGRSARILSKQPWPSPLTFASGHVWTAPSIDAVELKD